MRLLPRLRGRLRAAATFDFPAGRTQEALAEALADEAHEAAAAVGLRVLRSKRPGYLPDAGYMLVEPHLHMPVFGSHYDKTAQEVIGFCRGLEQ
ncbi:MAG: hypothetical protein GX652_00985 [Burkholderiaceae bacterium]|nr:hypothetical protein [Burkholderiaceae bacterium]